MNTVTQPISPPPPTWRPWAWAGAGVVIVVVALVAAFVLVPAAVAAAKRCGTGVRRAGPDAECVGVTDGSYVFDPGLKHVESLIRKENHAVIAAKAAYVTVAVLLPMTVKSDDDVTLAWIRRQLEGALLAQREANHSTLWGGNVPKLRVLLANPGSGLGQWRVAVDEIEHEQADQHIIAVTGIGLSLSTAQQAMRRLAELKIPIFASTLTADNIVHMPGFARVSPSNSEQAQAAAEYLKGRVHSALVVRDRNPDDLYPRTLAEQFQQHFPDADHYFVGPPEFYLSQDAGADDTLAQMSEQICVSHPDVIYFAGRAQQARTLIEALAVRQCQDRKFIVMTGDDLSLRGIGDDAIGGALKSGVEVDFTGLAHPAAWQQFPHAFAQESIANFTRTSPDPAHPCELCFQGLFPNESLDDGVALIGHDSVVAAIWAARNTVAGQDHVADPEEIIQILERLHGPRGVLGASGLISFDPITGDPTDKPIPILRLRPGRTPAFVTLSCPAGGLECTSPQP